MPEARDSAARSASECDVPSEATVNTVMTMNTHAGTQGAARATTSASGALASARSCHGTTETALIATLM